MLRLASDLGEVVVVRDQVGSPTYTGHLADGIVRLLDGESYGIHHIAGSGECSWYEFAVEIFRQTGFEYAGAVVHHRGDARARRPAARTRCSAPSTTYPIVLPDWREGLTSYLSERAAIA